MRIVSFRRSGVESFGVLHDDQVHDVRGVVEDATSLRHALASCGADLPARIAAFLESHEPPSLPLSEVDLLPPITDAAKIICAGVNYRAHRDEVGLADPPQHPTLFTRFNDSHVGAGRSVTFPPVTEKLDWEGEIAVVVGSTLSGVQSDAEAMAGLAGYSLYNDLSVRDWQMQSSQWTPGKNFAGVGAFGPALVTPDEIDDLAAIRLTTTVNGTVRQDAVLADLIFDIPSLIRYITTFTPLHPGDVVVTGTPGGVGMGMDPPQFLQPGDTVVVAATNLGELVTPIVASPTP